MQIYTEGSARKEVTHKISFRALADSADMQSISESMTSDVCFGMNLVSRVTRLYSSLLLCKQWCDHDLHFLHGLFKEVTNLIYNIIRSCFLVIMRLHTVRTSSVSVIDNLLTGFSLIVSLFW